MMEHREDSFDDYRPQHKPRLTLISLFIWLGIVAALGMLIVGLSGCAREETVSQVCYMRQLGRTSEGDAVVATVCQSPQAFADSQK